MRPIKLKTQRVRVTAPKPLLFEVVGAGGEVIEEVNENERLVEFTSEYKGRTLKTVERLIFHPHDAIEYEWIEGPLPTVIERISFEAVTEATTDMVYTGHFEMAGGLGRWIYGRTIVKRAFDRLVTEHLLEGKSFAEKRAERSRLYGS